MEKPTVLTRAYAPSDANAWDALVEKSSTGSFLHTQRFLSYHGTRFRELSAVIEDGDGKLVGVFPAALDTCDLSLVSSHPGATYGGLVTSPKAKPAEVDAMIGSLLDYYRGQGFERFIYKVVPPIFHRVPSELDVYALWRRGAELVRCDLWNALRLDQPRHHAKGHKWATNKARKLAMAVTNHDDEDSHRAFHALLRSCLDERHGAVPVHSEAELILLSGRFPENMTLWLVRGADGELLAGTWLFRYGQLAWHTQYIASTARGRVEGAVDLLLETVASEAEAKRVAWFSFGSCTEQKGKVLLEGLFQFKASFGAGSIASQFLQIDLTK